MWIMRYGKQGGPPLKRVQVSYVICLFTIFQVCGSEVVLCTSHSAWNPAKWDGFVSRLLHAKRTINRSAAHISFWMSLYFFMIGGFPDFFKNRRWSSKPIGNWTRIWCKRAMNHSGALWDAMTSVLWRSAACHCFTSFIVTHQLELLKMFLCGSKNLNMSEQWTPAGKVCCWAIQNLWFFPLQSLGGNAVRLYHSLGLLRGCAICLPSLSCELLETSFF